MPRWRVDFLESNIKQQYKSLSANAGTSKKSFQLENADMGFQGDIYSNESVMCDWIPLGL